MAHVQKITFVDNGQDFTEFFVREGIVIDCQPFQGAVWVGTKLVEPATTGQPIRIVPRKSGQATFLQHTVESVKTLEPQEAAEVVQYGHDWAKKLQIDPASLSL